MFSVFNGRKRSLFEEPHHSVFIQVDVQLLKHLHRFKGATLAVLMALALRMNEHGWCWPSIEQLQRDTGYSRNAIFHALKELCEMRIEGRRVLLRAQLREPDGTFASNCYLLFPTDEEVEMYDGKELLSTEYHFLVLGTRSPSTTFTDSVKVNPNNNHNNINHNQYEEEEEERRGKIKAALEELGVFPNAAQEIANKMVGAGFSPEEAREIFLRTLRSVAKRQGRSDEEKVALAVHRLRKGLWDTDQRVKKALKEADRFPIHIPSLPPKEEGEEDILGEIWRKTLDIVKDKVPRSVYSALFAQTCLVSLTDSQAVIEASAAEALQTKYSRLVAQVLAQVLGREVNVEFRRAI